ncbi:ATP-binding protein [Streptomyces beigongshangae]|uniref:ATP-binding protein n=1 Tax=Streptomyces beigongshangae TaxID=2841597 RepID=UPI001C8658E8|nr:ATP-binding protein [Streptomyces sp. REN17]
MTELIYPQIPEHSLMVLIGPSGAGKSTLARTWPASQVLSLDALREAVSDDAGDQDATAEAVDVLHLILERRMARRRFTVIDATNVTRAARQPLVAAAKRHNMPAVAVVVATPLDVCLERQGLRPDNQRAPEDVVRSQHHAMVHSHQRLAAEGFTIAFADTLYRLEPFLKQLSQTREDGLRRDGSEGLLLVRRFFGPEILPLWRWQPGPAQRTGRDRVAEICLGQQHLTLAFRHGVDNEGDFDFDFGFDVLLPCPFDPECAGQAWAPVYSVTDLHKALTGLMDKDPDIICTVHGRPDDVDDHEAADDDHEDRTGLQTQPADAVRA